MVIIGIDRRKLWSHPLWLNRFYGTSTSTSVVICGFEPPEASVRLGYELELAETMLGRMIRFGNWGMIRSGGCRLIR